MFHNLIFSPASFCLPAFAPDAPQWQQWAVIACDQFTSEPQYWAEAERIAADAPSTLGLILPEAYLGTEKEAAQRARIAASMEKWGDTLVERSASFLYLERTLPDGRVRRGLLGKIDLEQYDYAAGSTSAVRATEATVLERIPPRVAIRSAASLELPHVMLLIDDTEGLFAHLHAHREKYHLLYDFDLMLGGGHACGYHIEIGGGFDAVEFDPVLSKIVAYENARMGGLVYAVGDGNHSLAAARAHYENLKATLGEAALSHPARWALVELVALQDEALDFEPIYRVVECEDTDDFLASLYAVTTPGEVGAQSVCVLTEDGEQTVSFTHPTHALTVGTLQDFIDDYASTHPNVRCDYIHDEDSLRALATRTGCVGFLFAGMEKGDLFPYVRERGALPRKTFSMGEARSKRYYIEARRIVR